MKVIKWYKWTISSAAFVLVLLLLPSKVFPRTPRALIEIDKVVHAFLFGSVTAIFSSEYKALKKLSPPFFLSLAIIGVFAFLTEVSQLATKTRHFDMLDFCADIVGIGLALLITRLIANAQKPHR